MKRFIFLVMSVVLLFTASKSYAADPLDSWVQRPPATYDALTGITYGNRLFVAVGEHGALVTSPDGATWTDRNLNTMSNINGVTYGNGKFVAVGGGAGYENSIFAASSDGLTWNTGRTAYQDILSSIAYGNGKFVAVGNDHNTMSPKAVIMTSPDGITWENRQTKDVYQLNSITFANGQFVAVGGGWIDYGAILTSPDGINWAKSSFCTASQPCGVLNSVAYGDGMFIAAGHSTVTSSDGINWTMRSKEPYLLEVSYGSNTFIASNIDGIYSSSDGTTWTKRDSAGILGASVYGNQTFVAVGSRGTIMQSGTLVQDTVPTTTTKKDCYATLDTELNLHIPVLTYGGYYLWADFKLYPDTYYLSLTNAGAVADPSSYSSCSPSTLSAGFKLQIPDFRFSWIAYTSIWADFNYSHDLIWKLANAGLN